MNSSLNIEIRRCRPLLGTFVEITASGLQEAPLQAAINDAFAAIEKIQRMMSAHDPASELSVANRDAASRPVTLSRETFVLLRRADRLAVESKGAFDYTIAPTLARWGLLPGELARKAAGSWRDVLLLHGRQVYFLRPLAIDLGGIAKGYAVDAAIKVLQHHQVTAAIVNAGGDLRTFGSVPSQVHLRHPASPQALAKSIRLKNAALATSSPCFTEQEHAGKRISHLVNPARRKAITGAISVSVRAGECWLADALTKVVLNAPKLARTLLTRYQAEAFVISA